MKKYITLSLFVTLMMLLFSSVAYAQGPAACGDLSDDDCQIILDSQEAMLGLSSGSSDGFVDIFVGGIPDSPISEVAINITASSTFTADPEIQAEMMELQSMPMEEMMADMDEVADLVLQFYSSSNSDTSMTISMSDELAALISADSGIDFPATFSIGLILVDGILYADLSEFASISPEAAMLENWFGVNLVEILEMSMASMVEGQMDMSQMDPTMNSMMMGMGMSNSEMMADFVDVERLDDSDIDGEAVAVFQSVFDFNSFLASEEFKEMVQMQMAMSGDADMSPEEVDQLLSMVGLMAPMFTADLEAYSIQHIGLADSYIYLNEGVFAWDLAGLMSLAAMAGEGADLPEAAPVIAVETATAYSDFEADVEISAPEDAIIIPSDVVMESLAN